MEHVTLFIFFLNRSVFVAFKRITVCRKFASGLGLGWGFIDENRPFTYVDSFQE